MGLSDDDVRKILRLLETSNFDELILDIDGMKLVLRRGDAAMPAPGRDARAESSSLAPTGREAVRSPDRPHAGGDVILAPMVGTFYRAPKPGAAPFVEVGSVVEPATVVGIIEVMKLMKAVNAGARGRIIEICVADGAPVQYGQVLFRLEPVP